MTIRSINTVMAFVSWGLMMVGLDQGQYLMALAMASTLAITFMIESKKI